MNICPHDKKLKNKAKFEVNDESNLNKLEEKNITIIDPLTKKRLISELKYYLDDIEEKKKNLENLKTIVQNTKNELSKVSNNTNQLNGNDIENKVELTEDEIDNGKNIIYIICF